MTVVEDPPPAAEEALDLASLALKLRTRRAEIGLDEDGRPRLTRPEGRAGAADPPAPVTTALTSGTPVPLPATSDEEAPPTGSMPFPALASPDGKRFVLAGGVFPCFGCKKKLDHPGYCATCAERITAKAERERLRLLVLERLPEENHDVTWDNVRLLSNRTGGRRVHLSPERLVAIRSSLETDLLSVLVGPNGCGKTTLGACFVREALTRGRPAYFVPAINLNDPDEPAAYRQAVSASDLVIDDLGAELLGAPVKGGLAGQRIMSTIKLLRARFSRRRRTVITTEYSQAQLVDIYQRGNVRRIHEGVTEIPLEGPPED